MADGIKVALKAALVGGILVTLAYFILNVPVPTVDVGLLTYYINKAYTIAIHWCPVLGTLYPYAVNILVLQLLLWTFRAGLFAYKTIMVVVE